MSTKDPTSSTGERILVVDDSKSVRDFLVDYVLKPRGYEITLATNGLDGLKLAAAHEPDLMIVDNQMPQLTGIELLRTLRESGLEVPAILITAHGSEEIAVEAFRLGIRDYVIKPFEVDEITAAIDRALREKRLERERDVLTNKLVDSNLQLQRRVQELNTLYGIGKSVSSSLEIEEVLHRVVEGAVYVASAEEGALLLLDELKGELYVRASQNLDADGQSIRLQVSDSYAGEALQTQRPLIFGGDVPSERDFLSAYGVKSMLYMPLVAQGQPLGVLSVANRHRDIPFTDREARILSPLANYAAVAISNARLYSQTENERHKLKTLLSQTDDPIILVDEQGRLALINAAACAVLNIAPANSIGQPITKLVRNRAVVRFITQPVDRDIVPHSEVTGSDGRIFNANMTIIEGVGRSVLMRDMTRFKKLENLRSELVSIVSHDLRSPLTSILSYVEMVAMAGQLSQTQQEYIERIRGSIDSITEMIDALLDVERMEAGLDLKLAPCSLSTLLEEIVHDMRADVERKQHDLEVDIDELPELYADANRLHQAFSNLLSNAIKFTPDGGHLKLKAYQHYDQFIVTIADNGVGISPSNHAYIFDKFYQGDNSGDPHGGSAGLGLSIVKAAIEQHQGRVWVQSAPGEGATFYVVLPPGRNGGPTRPSGGGEI